MKTPKKKTSQLPEKSLPTSTPLVSEMLTPEEIEQLRHDKKELNAYAQKAFAYLRPVKEERKK